MLYDTCELIVQNTKQLTILKLEFDLIRYFSITSPISETILQNYRNGVDWKVYKEALKYYNENVILQRKRLSQSLKIFSRQRQPV
jgi:hypothetical protein